MSVLTSTLERLSAEGRVVDVFRDYLSGDALTGVISHHNEEFLLLSLFDDFGNENGAAIIFASDVTRVRWESNSLNSITQLIERNSSAPFIPVVDIGNLKNLIQSVQNSCGHVTLHTERMDGDVCFIGELEEVDESAVIIKEYGSISGRDSARIMVPVDEITRIDAGGNYEKSIAFLARTPLNRTK